MTEEEINNCDGHQRSNCCDALIYEETDICSDCKEHCATACEDCQEDCYYRIELIKQKIRLYI